MIGVAILLAWLALLVFIVGRAIVRHWRADFGQQRRRGFEVGCRNGSGM